MHNKLVSYVCHIDQKDNTTDKSHMIPFEHANWDDMLTTLRAQNLWQALHPYEQWHLQKYAQSLDSYHLPSNAIESLPCDAHPVHF